MSKFKITTTNTSQAPAAIGPYSQACSFGGLTFVSGQLGLVPETGLLVSDDVVDQSHQALLNLKAIASAERLLMTDIVKLTLYLVDLSDFKRVNDVLSQTLLEPYPARATVGVAALPMGAKIEIDAIIANTHG